MRRFIVATLLSTMLMPSHGAIKFDGTDDNVNIGGASTFNVNTITVSAWVNVTAAKSYPMIVSRDTSAVNGEAGVELRLHDVTGFPSLMVDTAGVDRQVITGASSIVNTGWRHLAGTYDGVTQKLYLDGTLIASNSLAGAIDWGGSPVMRFGSRGITGLPYQGLIEDIRIYGRALNVSEIQSLAFSRSRLNITDGLIGYWPLDDGINGIVNGTALDRSGNRNTGTLTSGPIWIGSTWISYP